MVDEGEPFALRGGGEYVDNTNDNDDYCEDYNNDEDGEPDKNCMVDEEQPFALQGGGDSRIKRTTKKKKLTKAETSRMQEQKWETMLADVGLRPQDQPDSEVFSSNSSSNTSNDSSSTIGESDSD
jgi:hypothetical protein